MPIAVATVEKIGDVRPSVALSRRLVEREHAVTAVTWPVRLAAMTIFGIRVP